MEKEKLENKVDPEYFRRELRILSQSVDGLSKSRIASRLRRLAKVADGELCPACKRHPLLGSAPVCASCVTDGLMRELAEL